MKMKRTMIKEKITNRGELAAEFDKATHALLQMLRAFDQQQINRVPYEGSWTAAQVAEHLFKSDSAVLQALHGPTKEAERPADENAVAISQAFLDFSTKMKSPDIVTPATIDHEKEALISALHGTRQMMKRSIKTLELSAICTDRAMSAIVGEWTRLEFFNFVIVHTRRHVHQLEKIHAALNQ